MCVMKINEIFYSLQGEGFWTGTPMVFVRFAGCNLCCPFCDTDWTSFTEMTIEEILAEVGQYPTRRVCITGGEPCLQLTEDLVEALHEKGFQIHMESNGTIPPPQGIDWLTVSPKGPFLKDGEGTLAITECDELKVLYPSDPSRFDGIKARYRFLQPIDTGDTVKKDANTRQTIDYIYAHPQWRLSLQTHKLLNIR